MTEKPVILGVGRLRRRGPMALAAVVVLLVACRSAAVELPASSAAVPPYTAPVATKLDADTRVTAPGGATLVVAKGWFVSRDGARVVLQDPDQELTVTLVDNREPTGQDAVEAAWRSIEPGFAWPIRRTSAPPPAPWDEVLRIEYETTAAEARSVSAVARRHGAVWYVALVDGARGVVDRRAAQLNLAFSSLSVPGLVRESWRGRAPHRLDPARAAAFHAFVEDARRRAGVPGAAVAIVQGGAVVYEQGFGVRRAGAAGPVTPDTLFMIGSITKSLTSLMMAVQVDRGRFTWNTPVRELMPSFALGSADATRELAIKHTVCACTGLPRQDMEFFFGYLGATPESRLAAMRTMVPTTGIGETYQYSNSLVSAGGYIAARVHRPDLPLGAAYDQAMADLVFAPVGMTGSTFDFDNAEQTDHARPHGMTLGGGYAPLALSSERWLPPIRPAGGAWSSARDLARYVQLELADGVAGDGRRVVSRENLLARRVPQVKTDQWSSYGLALRVRRLHDVTVVGHGGSTSGFSALLFFLPDHDLGGVVLSNAWGAAAFVAAVRDRLLELLFDGRDEASRRLDFALQQRAEGQARTRARLENPPPAAVVQPLLGTYANDRLGRIRLARDGERVVLDASDWRSTVGTRTDADGRIRLILLDPPWSFFEILAEPAGGSPRLTIERPQRRYVFDTVPTAQ